MPGLEELLERWRAAGLITPAQANAIRAYEERTRPAAAAEAARFPESGSNPPPPAAPIPENGPNRPSPAAPIPENGPKGRAAADLPAFGLGADLAVVDLAALGAVLAALALLALLANIFGVIADLLVGPGTHVAGQVEDVVHLVASVCGLVGGLRLLQGRADGRRLVYWSLGLNLAATLLLGGHQLLQLWTWVNLVTWVVLAVMVARARYRGRYRWF